MYLPRQIGTNEFDDGLFREKYRIKSTRLSNWDYGSDGYYFVTICTKNMIECFGEIRNGIMGLNEMGCTVAKFWQEIPEHFENVKLDEWVVMPNHVHGVIIINNIPPVETSQCAETSQFVETSQCNVSTDNRVRKYPKNHIIHQRFSKISPKSKSLSTIVGSFKSIFIRTIHKQYPNIHFQWQERFYDHIIRNEKSLNKIRQYILNNPWKWQQDRNNPKGVWV